MQQLNEFLHTISTMPSESFGPALVICGFALAGYAIYAVSTIARGKK
jgi:hypothetical protein